MSMNLPNINEIDLLQIFVSLPRRGQLVDHSTADWPVTKSSNRKQFSRLKNSVSILLQTKVIYTVPSISETDEMKKYKHQRRTDCQKKKSVKTELARNRKIIVTWNEYAENTRVQIDPRQKEDFLLCDNVIKLTRITLIKQARITRIN